MYKEADRVAKSLTIDDYVLDEKTKRVTLTEDGVKHAEKLLKVTNLYDIKNSVLVHNLDKALVANYGFKKDVDYVVENDKVLIVDDFLAIGNAVFGLMDIIKQANAELCGIAIGIEKGFQGGGDKLRQMGLHLESLAVIESMSDSSLVFRK